MDKYNDHSQPVRNLINRVLAVVDDSQDATEVVADLAAAGIDRDHILALGGRSGLYWIDADGAHGNWLTRLVRSVQTWTVEGAHLRRYQSELTGGHYLIDIHIDPSELGAGGLRILRAHGAHFINGYGRWTIESLAA